ncbi:dnaJ homolog subfamily C member 11-like [Poecilia formosa]|uniref:dnaJ homolog subfamily C member 11-like n=1 Tax=Poecilia formosa TaxID=48698 RepID=UPI000444492B|nr:PREDICTED: dnaJ homolog subfamily C member 11-like [Poecilia formosa]
MAASTEDDFEFNTQDYYSLLNVRKEATVEELKASYRRLCMLYHPDKHRDPELKRQAEQLFNQVHQAYEVLSDAHSRAIYDIFGKKGLEVEGWEVVERKRTPAEIREEYERLQREKEERRLQQRTNPKGTISVGVDATDLFDRYDDDFEEMPGGGFPHIEINRMHISQSIEAPLTNTDTAMLSGSLSTHNGSGGGNINVTVRRVTSAKGWGEVEFGAGDTLGPLIGLKVFRNVTPRCFLTAQCGVQFSPRGLRPSCSLMTARHLDQNTMGYLQWRWGPNSAMTTSLVRDTKSSHFTLALQLGVPHSYLMMSYQYKFQDEDQTKVKGSVKTGWFGTVVEYGAERKISRHSVLSATVSIGVPQGVTLKIKYEPRARTFLCVLVQRINTYFFLKILLIQGLSKGDKHNSVLFRKKKKRPNNAGCFSVPNSAIKTLQCRRFNITCSCSTNPKHAVNFPPGLIILNGWYGKFVSDTSQKQEKAKVIDVTVPLQCLVKDSKLILTEASKAGLPGFYDPCVGEEKSLKLLYQFRGVMHQVISADTEPLRIPKQSHRTESES